MAYNEKVVLRKIQRLVDQKSSKKSTLGRKRHKELFSMASISTGGIGPSCHMGATFLKKVQNFKIKYLKFQESKRKSGNPDFGKKHRAWRTKQIKLNCWSYNSG